MEERAGGLHQFTPIEKKELERRAQMERELDEKGSLTLQIDGDEVVVRRFEGKFVWEASGVSHECSFWPDEKVGTAKGDPTFYRVTREVGYLNPRIPAAEHYRRFKSGQPRRDKPETPLNFQAEE